MKIIDVLMRSVPNFIRTSKVESWMKSESMLLSNIVVDESARMTFTSITADVAMGAGDEIFQRFMNASVLVDWSCYADPVDRVDIKRLHEVIRTFPKGFRLWLCIGAERKGIPVGYTGWYPISAEAFSKAHDCPASLRNRAELWPLNQLSSENNGNYIWLFNYSIIKNLQRTEQSRKMLQTYATDMREINILGAAAAVLSDASVKIARRFGLTYRGDMTHQGVSEKIFAAIKPHAMQRQALNEYPPVRLEP